jgi:hypothetical protein
MRNQARISAIQFARVHALAQLGQAAQVALEGRPDTFKLALIPIERAPCYRHVFASDTATGATTNYPMPLALPLREMVNELCVMLDCLEAEAASIRASARERPRY